MRPRLRPSVLERLLPRLSRRSPASKHGWMSWRSSSSEQKAMEAKARKDLYFKVLRQGSFALLDDDERAKAREWGIKQVGAQDVKALSLADDTTGGFLAPPEFVQDIIKGVQLISPIRSIANVRSTSRRSINYPVRLSLIHISEPTRLLRH